MGSTFTKNDQWREVYRRQRLKNAHLWLEELERTADPIALAKANYDKLLQAIEQTLKHEDSFSVGCDLLREITPIAFEMSDWGRLLIYLKSALFNSKKLTPAYEAYLHEWIADIELSLTHMDEAEIHFNKALQLYLNEGEMVRYARILPRLARLFAGKGQIDKGIELCCDALNIGIDHDEKIVIADAYLGLADANSKARKWEQALDQCEKAYSNYIDIGKENFVFKTRVLAVACKSHLQRDEEAKAEAEVLLSQLAKSENAYDNLMDSVYLRNIIGIMAFKQGDYVTAEKHWQEAYTQNMLIGVPDLTASFGNNLGKVYTKLKEYETAEKIFLEALDLFDQLGDVTRWANCMDNLADLYEEMGETAALVRTLEQAIARLEPRATMDHSQELLRSMQHRLNQIQDN